MMTDLDELERLHAGLPVLRAETWNHEDGEGHAAIIAVFEPDCDDDEHPGAYDAAVAGVRIINALPGLIAEIMATRAGDAWVDAALPEDADIKAAHPSRTGDHTLYAEARRLVGARRAKSSLVDLANWLLSRTVEAERNAESEFAERKRIAEASGRAIIAANEASLRHLEARMRDEAELAALREVAEAARDYRETNDDGHRCGGSSGDQCAGCMLTAALAKVPK